MEEMSMKRDNSYLSERFYPEDNGCEYNKEKLEYWEELLGQKTFHVIWNKVENIPYYMKDDNFYIREGMEKKLENYIRDIKLKEKGYMFTNQTKKYTYFPRFYHVFLEYGLNNLRSVLKGKETYYSDIIYSDFLQCLAGRLQKVCIRTLIAEMHIYKESGTLIGQDTKEEYEFFCEKVAGNIEFIEELLGKYPVLYRCVNEKIQQTVMYYNEVIENFKKDIDDIRQKLCGETTLFKIVKVKADFSDVHNNGKQVLRIELDNGMEILYKPHSMENEKAHEELLCWISEAIGISQYRYPFLTYRDHSWSSTVEHKSCSSEQQLKDYYLRLGIQLFLAYLLGTKDLHYENLIACGEHPVLIDMETLVNIRNDAERTTVNDEIYYQLSQSVLCTGILPFYYWNQDGNGINSSAIGGIDGQRYPFKVPYVSHAGTSEMRIEYHYPISEAAQNQATLQGQFQNPSNYKKQLVSGFIRAYQHVMKHKDEFGIMLEKLRATKSRFLAADTQRYAMLLSSSYHPSLLGDGADRELFLYSLWKGRGESEAALVKCEVKALLNGDIPYFYNYLDGTSLYTGEEDELEYYFSHAVIEYVYQKLYQLNNADMEKQCGYIELAMDLMPDSKDNYINRVYHADECSYPIENIDTEKIKRQIWDLTERLLKYEVWNRNKTEVSWYTVQLSAYGKPTWEIHPMNMYLYDGLAGMLLIMYRLKKVDERKEIKQIFETLEKMLFQYTDKGERSLDNLQTKNTGAYEGESSIIYTYLIMYHLSQDEKFLNYAKKHALIVGQLLDGDNKYDLLCGNAGAAYVLLYLYETIPDKKYVDMAERAISILEETAEKQERGIGWTVEKGIKPMTGMAHGNSGILMPIITLWMITGKERYEYLAEQIWQYEDSLYNPQIHNWEDMRADRDERDRDTIGSVAWCHGAAGILLSRIECYKKVKDEKWKDRLERDISKAYEKVEEYWKRDSFCLCHGTYGNLWTLENVEKTIVRVIQDKEGIAIKKRYINDAIKLLPQEKINPGFLNGYGGILYYLITRTK